MLIDTTPLNVLQLSSSHLNSSSHLGASVPCIPDYVYSQLTPPTVTLSPEGKKIQQDICVLSQRGKWKKKYEYKVHLRKLNWHFVMSYPSLVLASLKSVHETLSQERQKVQEVWDANNVHSSNTLAEVRFTLHIVIWFHISPVGFLFPSPSINSLQPWAIYLKGLLQWQTLQLSTLTPVMTCFVVVPLSCLMNLGLVMEAPPIQSQRKDMVSTNNFSLSEI